MVDNNNRLHRFKIFFYRTAHFPKLGRFISRAVSEISGLSGSLSVTWQPANLCVQSAVFTINNKMRVRTCEALKFDSNLNRPFDSI